MARDSGQGLLQSSTPPGPAAQRCKGRGSLRFSSPLTDGTKTWPGAEKEEGEEGEEGRDCCFCVGLCASFNAARLLFHGVIVTQWFPATRDFSRNCSSIRRPRGEGEACQFPARDFHRGKGAIGVTREDALLTCLAVRSTVCSTPSCKDSMQVWMALLVTRHPIYQYTLSQ